MTFFSLFFSLCCLFNSSVPLVVITFGLDIIAERYAQSLVNTLRSNLCGVFFMSPHYTPRSRHAGRATCQLFKASDVCSVGLPTLSKTNQKQLNALRCFSALPFLLSLIFARSPTDAKPSPGRALPCGRCLQVRRRYALRCESTTAGHPSRVVVLHACKSHARLHGLLARLFNLCGLLRLRPSRPLATWSPLCNNSRLSCCSCSSSDSRQSFSLTSSTLHCVIASNTSSVAF